MPWDVALLLRHGDWRCATEDVLLRPALAWLQWSRTLCTTRLNTAMSHCALRRKIFVDSKSEAGVSNACVFFSDFQRYCTKGPWLHASFTWRTSSKHILQTMEAILSIFWMTSVIFGQIFRLTSAEVDCATTIAMVEIAIRTHTHGTRDESDHDEDIYQVSWEAGFRSWWQNLLPWRSSEGKQRRNFVGELVGATCTTSCLFTHHSQCQCACNMERLPGLFSAFPGYL